MLIVQFLSVVGKTSLALDMIKKCSPFPRPTTNKKSTYLVSQNVKMVDSNSDVLVNGLNMLQMCFLLLHFMMFCNVIIIGTQFC